VSTSFTTSRGTAIHIDEAGGGRPVLALHGLGGGAYFFRGLSTHMGERHRVLAVDLPGTGLSAVTAPYSMASWVEDLGELVRHHIGEPVTIAGHSMGTIIALEATRTWPEWIRGLVFIGGLPEVRPEVRMRLLARAEALAASSLAGWGAKVSPGIFSPATFTARPEVIGLFERLFETQDVAAYLRCLHILLAGAAGSAVPGVRVPTLAITGRDDQYAPPDAVHAFMQAMTAPHRVEVVPDAGHMLFFEQPATLAALVGGFLDELG
jgi:pimeloyl-ACP methyl ester carboxylesterase